MQNSGHFVVTLTTGAQALSTATGATFSPDDGKAPIKWLSIQHLAASTGPAYGGFAGALLSTTSYAWQIPTPVSTVPAAPFIIEGINTSLDQVVVLGGAGDKLAIGFIRD